MFRFLSLLILAASLTYGAGQLVKPAADSIGTRGAAIDHAIAAAE